jgi:hypothetical protein
MSIISAGASAAVPTSLRAAISNSITMVLRVREIRPLIFGPRHSPRAQPSVLYDCPCLAKNAPTGVSVFARFARCFIPSPVPQA